MYCRSPVGFPETKRSGVVGDIQRCCRFGSSSTKGWHYGSVRDAINISVNKDIMLHGVCFFGRENNTYSVDLEVINTESKSVLVSKTGQFSSDQFELLQSEKGSYYGFELLFDTKITLGKNTTYCVSAEISGSTSLRGVNCVSSVKCSGVTFTFMNAEYSKMCYRTNVTEGQFPELLFSLK